MEGLKTFKLLASLFLVSITVVLVTGFYGSGLYINHLTPQMGEAEYPEKSFNSLANKIDADVSTDVGPENLDDSSFSDRIKLEKLYLLDSSKTGSRIATDGNGTNLTGFRFEDRCYRENSTAESRWIKCESYNKRASIPGGWIDNLRTAGALEETFENTTKMELFEEYIQRLNYYNSKLATGGARNPFYISAYENNSGLYLIGDQLEEASINGETYRVENKGLWNFIDIKLEPGNHEISYSNTKRVFKVYSPVKIGIKDETVQIEDTENFYRHIEIETENRKEKIRINRTYREDIETEKANITFISNKVNITRTANTESTINTFKNTCMLEKHRCKLIIKASNIREKISSLMPLLNSSGSASPDFLINKSLR